MTRENGDPEVAAEINKTYLTSMADIQVPDDKLQQFQHNTSFKTSYDLLYSIMENAVHVCSVEKLSHLYEHQLRTDSMQSPRALNIRIGANTLTSPISRERNNPIVIKLLGTTAVDQESEQIHRDTVIAVCEGTIADNKQLFAIMQHTKHTPGKIRTSEEYDGVIDERRKE